jgi:hypothetical protein
MIRRHGTELQLAGDRLPACAEGKYRSKRRTRAFFGIDPMASGDPARLCSSEHRLKPVLLDGRYSSSLTASAKSLV